jgi:hypothetical protein
VLWRKLPMVPYCPTGCAEMAPKTTTVPYSKAVLGGVAGSPFALSLG